MRGRATPSLLSLIPPFLAPPRARRFPYTYSVLIPAFCATRVHFSRSELIVAVSADASIQIGSRPTPASLWRTSSSSNALFKESRILSSIAVGVLGCANAAYQLEATTSGSPCAEIGMTSGITDEGLVPVVPSAFNLPDLMWGNA